MKNFTEDELTLMMIYNPGTRKGLMDELTNMQSNLTECDQNLRIWTESVLIKLSAMRDDEFEEMQLYPDF